MIPLSEQPDFGPDVGGDESGADPPGAGPAGDGVLLLPLDPGPRGAG